MDTYLDLPLFLTFALLDKSVITQRPSSTTIIAGGNVTLYCNATGNPAPNITWTKDGSPTVLYQGKAYGIVNIQKQAAGDYTCTASNGVGVPKNATATVTVHCKFTQSFILVYVKQITFCLIVYVTHFLFDEIIENHSIKIALPFICFTTGKPVKNCLCILEQLKCLTCGVASQVKHDILKAYC